MDLEINKTVFCLGSSFEIRLVVFMTLNFKVNIFLNRFF